jgi:hypothetical protein
MFFRHICVQLNGTDYSLSLSFLSFILFLSLSFFPSFFLSFLRPARYRKVDGKIIGFKCWPRLNLCYKKFLVFTQHLKIQIAIALKVFS